MKYIEAISDAEFMINTTGLPAFKKHRTEKDDVLVGVKIDGVSVKGRFKNHAELNKSTPWNIPIEGAAGIDEDGRTTTSAFRFAAVEIGKVCRPYFNHNRLISF